MTKQLISALVVENTRNKNSHVRDIITRSVRKTYVANSAGEALDLYKKKKPNVVITDIKLSGQSGFGFIEELLDIDKHARIVITSASARSKFFLKAIEYGVKGFLVKPPDPEKVHKILGQIAFEVQLEKKAREQECKRKKAEKALQKSEEIMHAVGFAAEQFLKFNYGDQSIKNVLKRLGTATGVSRVYIFRNSRTKRGDMLTSQQFEWVDEGIRPQINNPQLQNLSYHEAGYQRWTDTLSKNLPLYGTVDDMPESEQNNLKSQNIVSLIVVPIFVYNQWWGFMGFDDCLKEREWTEAEISALMAAANILGAAIHRKKVEVEFLRLNNELESRINQRTKDLYNEIRERAQIEDMLRESEEKYRLIFENANDGILLSVDGIVRFINPKLHEITGYLPRESIGKPFVNFLHPEYRDMVLENHYKRLHGEEVQERYDVKFLDKSGNEKWFEIKSNLITWEGEAAVLSFLTDITERKETAEELRELNRNLEKRVTEELEKISQQQQLLIQKSKLESLGELAAGMAHEINQPLGSISMGMDNILFKLSKNELSEEYVQRKFDSLFQDISRIRSIIEHIRIFSRDQQAQKNEKISINDVIINALSLITTQYRNHGILLSLELSDKDCYAYGNMYKLEQVILNLLSNAKYAVDEKEATAAEEESYQKRITISTARHNGQIEIEIRDNGIGIAGDVINNIFDPFFTTKKAEIGTGLGLSIIYGIVKEMKGDITAQSEINKYTRMSVLIPEYGAKRK
ncbi:MAG: PAS domain S-box protein [Bacteroidales bacterium]